MCLEPQQEDTLPVLDWRELSGIQDGHGQSFIITNQLFL